MSSSQTRSSSSSNVSLALSFLWVAWGLATLALLLFVRTTLTSREQSLLASRREQAEGVTADLSQAFENLQNLPSIASREARTLSEEGELSRVRFQELCSNFYPFGHLFLVDAEGRPYWSDLSRGEPPTWLVAMAHRRQPKISHETLVLRPLPPGLEAGKVEIQIEPDTPELYLAAVTTAPDGGFFLAQLDLEYIFDSWLKKRVERSSLGDGLSARPVTPFERVAALDEPEATVQSEEWIWSLPTFFSDDPFPFPALTLTLDNRPALRAERRWVLGLALASSLVMAALGVTLLLTVRAVRRELEYAQARARFTDMVGHELRTPVSAISMYAEILREGLIDDPDKLATYHEQLRLQTERLRALIERVLTFARLEAGQSTVRLVETGSRELLEMAAKSVQSLGHPVKILDGPDPRVSTDPEVVISILVNLLENAIKHSHSGSPVELQAVAGENKELEFWVLDRGPGVPQASRQKIFEPYHTGLDSDRISLQGGTKKSGMSLGLGLTIARGLARSLDGRIDFREREGGGSVFALVLPGPERSVR